MLKNCGGNEEESAEIQTLLKLFKMDKFKTQISRWMIYRVGRKSKIMTLKTAEKRLYIPRESEASIVVPSPEICWAISGQI